MTYLTRFFGLVGCISILTACGSPPTPTPVTIRNASAAKPSFSAADLEQGEKAYNATCAACHGPKATGTTLGPPLVHKIYEPSHHSDTAFVLAVQRGVAAHHWKFGDMPPQPHISPDEIRLITGYVRTLQRAAGIQ